MDTLLVTVTAAALTMTLGMALVLVKLLREERLRSAARVAALSVAAEGDDGRHVPRATSREVDGKLRADRREPSWDLSNVDLNLSGPATHAHVAREHVAPQHVGPQDGAREHMAPGTWRRTGDASTAAETLFASRPASTPWGARLAVAATLAAVVGFGGYTLLTRTRIAGSTVPSLRAVPLELLSLRHAQQPESLTVTGLVQNPRGGAALSGVIATAFVFAGDGSFLASGRAPLDFSTLAAGDESPFVITVPVTAPVARYRIGFRDRDGRVIAHVDRRMNGTMAGFSAPSPDRSSAR